MKTIGFFNNKGGVGKTSLVYHLAWMFAHLNLKVMVCDLDPQSNQSAMFLSEEEIEALWSENKTIYGAMKPLLEGTGDILSPPYIHIIPDQENLGLLPGDLRLSMSEPDLNSQWPECLSSKPRAFRVLSAFYRMIHSAAKEFEANVVLVDMGPNLGAINRAALLSLDFLIVPLSADIYSLQGLRNLGPTLIDWRKEWKMRLNSKPPGMENLPLGNIVTSGYVVMQHNERLDRPVKAYGKWMQRIPETYREYILDHKKNLNSTTDVHEDPECIAQVKHYRSLMAMAQEAQKPMFFLKPADGAIGTHFHLVQESYTHFETMAKKIMERCSISLPL